ncbi:hypothetical protein BYT27DRAFT_7199625 [Phlegmacium glaucopus]|nr:hypothetical protein BYT27DRAFT_7199625 [Phlegmacium glaucopus]
MDTVPISPRAISWVQWVEVVVFGLKLILVYLSASGPGYQLEQMVHVYMLGYSMLFGICEYARLAGRYAYIPTRMCCIEQRGKIVRSTYEGDHLGSLISSFSFDSLS